MPEPSVLPILNAVGVTLALVGLTLSIAVTRDRRAALRRHAGDAGSAPPRTSSRSSRPTITPRTDEPARIGFALVGVEQPDVSSPEGAPALAERYATAFAAHLDQGGESGLGEAYALGREAVAGQYSVLDFADAHHSALTDRALLGAARPPGRDRARCRGIHPREPVGVRDRGARLPRGAGDRAHRARARRAAARAGRRVRRDQLLADRRRDPPAHRRRRPRRARRGARVDRDPGGRAAPAAARRDLAREPRGLRDDTFAHEREPARAGARPRLARGRRPPRARVHPARRRRSSRSSASSRRARSPTRACTAASARSRARSSARCGRASCPTVPGLAAAVRFNAAGEGVELGGDFYDLFRGRDGGWAALIGDIQGKGPEAAAVTALARHTLRAAAAYEHRPSGVLTLLHRELREQVADGRFCTVAYAYMQVVPGHVRLELACGGHPLPLIVHHERHGRGGRPARHAARLGRRAAARRHRGRARPRRRARLLHRRRHGGPPPAPRGVRHRAADRAAARAAAA